MSFRSQQSYVSRTNSHNLDVTFNVFYVNNGYMLGIKASKDATIDELQNHISDNTSIPKKEQMIYLADGNLPSIGVSLKEDDIGTERNPLFLYQRTSRDDPITSEESEGLERIVQQFQEEVNVVINGQSHNYQKYSNKSLATANIAVQLSKKLIDDHKHLSEAWGGMIKFLDDRTERLSKRYVKFEAIMRKMDDARKDGHIIFNDFGNVFDTLKRITLPTELLSAANEKEITLYDWIKSKDPVHQLNDLVTHVQEELVKLDDKPVRHVKTVLDGAITDLKKKDIREVGKLEERLNMLKQRLKILIDNERKISNTLHQVANNPDAVIKSPETLKQVRDMILDMTETAKSIIRSKTELLNVIRQRARKNFLMAYEVLFKADGDIIIFEEKARHLGDQLKLLNQIRETPILFATAVVEVIRRETLQKEFTAWLSIHNEKCNNFLEEENRIRDQFNRKFDKHFLRQIFYGVSDKMPGFSSPVHPFDAKIPKIKNSYLHALRDELTEMSSLLNVQLPNVFNRLSVVDKTSLISIETSNTPLRPSESFFTHEKTTNMDIITRNFPSSTSLMGLDAESSPRSYNMNRFGHPFSSQSSLSFSESAVGTPCGLNPSFDLGPKDDDASRSSYYTKSDPICIPSRGSNQNQISATSSQFNTPDNEFGSPEKNRFHQIASEDDNPKIKGVTIGILNEYKAMIASLQEEIGETRKLYEESAEEHDTNFEGVFTLLEQVQQEMQRRLEEHVAIIDEIRAEKQEFAKIVEHEKYLRREKEAEVEDAHNTIKKQNEELLAVIKAKDDLHADILKLETEKRRLENTIEHSGDSYLNIELKTLQDILNRQLSDEEVERIKSEVEQRRRVLSPTPSEQNEKGTRTSQADYENALRKKMQLIISGIENKKDIEVAKMREEIQAEINAEKKDFEDLMHARIADLEKKVAFYQNLNEDRTRTPPFVGSPPSDRPCSSNELLFNKGMQESCLVVNHVPRNVRNDFETPQEEDEDICIAGEDEVTEINTVGTQTRIRMKEMSMMISLQDIHEGCSVLVMWDNSHNSYMVFSTSRTLHFVRESCMRRFCADTQSATRRNWMFAVVTHIDYCQIRKESNRYNMPLGTRFYRVEVKPLAIEQSSTAPSRRS